MDHLMVCTSRDEVLYALKIRYGMIDVIGWYTRGLFDGFTTVYMRICGETSPRNVRVFDGGLIEELSEGFYIETEGN